MKKILKGLIILTLLVGMMPMEAAAASKNVRVTLPDFAVTLNGIKVENDYRQYPLIVYQNVTYFPMTYYDCRFLGTETKWDKQKGLEINQTGVAAAYRDYRAKIKNKKSYTAAIPVYDVKVNGKAIQNAAEKYPLLVFRNITYFPMTWKFAVDQFGWKFSFDVQNGLKIQSSNPQLQKNILSKYSQGDVVEAAGYYYYGGAKGEIFQAPMANLKNIKKIYQLPIWDYGDGTTYVGHSLYKKDGEVWLTYHQGGASMGSDFYIRLKQDGTTEQVQYGYLTFKTFEDITIMVNQGVPPGPNNLSIKYSGKEYQPLGLPAYLYGWIWKKDENSESGGGSEDLYLVGHDLYILAFNTQTDTDKSRVHKVNIDTNETTRVSDLTAQFFKIDEGYIYISSEGTLYKKPLNGGTEENIGGPASNEFQFQVLNANIYYVNSKNNGLYEGVSKRSINPGAKVTGMKLESGYLVCTFKEEASNPYRLIVIDKNGKIIFKTSDVASINNVTIEKGKIYYLEDTSHNVYITDLPE